jgi:hypothetical protein
MSHFDACVKPTVCICGFFVCLDYVGYQTSVPPIMQDVIHATESVSTHSHTPCHCEAHSTFALYIHSLGICFFLYMNLSSWFKQYKLPVQCTMTQDALYAAPQ